MADYAKLLDPSYVPLIAGFSGGLVSTSILLPLDVVKLRLQVTESKVQRRFRSLRILGGIVKYEGFQGLYVGWTPAVVGSAISWGGYFFIYERLKLQLSNYRRNGDESTIMTTATRQSTAASLSSTDNFFLACTAGTIMVALTNPIWLIKTRMQLQMKRTSETHKIKPYTGIWNAATTIVREEGPSALYKGSGAALLLTSHGGVQFVVYEYLRKHFHVHRLNRAQGRDMSPWERFEKSLGYLTMGAIAKLVATTATYPLQVLKARLQQPSNSLELMDDGNVRHVRRYYSGLIHTVRRIVRKEGVQGLFKGCVPNAFRVAPGAAITFLVYEEVTDALLAST